MSRLFNLENPFMQFLSKVFDLIVLNIIFILTCIPVFTIGASLSALYDVSLKMVRKRDTYVIKGYFHAFVSNFKQSTIIWIFCVFLFFFFQYDYMIITSQNSIGFQVVRILFFMVLFILIAAFFYIFPIASHFVCTIRQLIRNAFLMSLGHLPYTLIFFVYYAAVYFIATRSVTLLGGAIAISMICGFSVTAYLFSIIFSRIFKKYEPEESEEDPM